MKIVNKKSIPNDFIIEAETQKFDKCTGVIVIEENRILLGLRTDGQGWCIAGGKIEKNETAYECAIRELKEEFGLTAVNLDYLGQVESRSLVRNIDQIVMPHIFLCKQFISEVKIAVNEISEYKWVSVDETKEISNLFPPSRKAIEIFSHELL